VTLLYSASLSINIASVSTYLTYLSPSPSVGLCVGRSAGLSVCLWKVYFGKTANWIWMPFRMVSGISRGMGVLDEGGDRQRGRAIFDGRI